jgi:hypothetical protein
VHRSDNQSKVFHLRYISTELSEADARLNNLRIQPVPQRKHNTNTNINWLMLFKKIIPVYSENHTKHINTKCRDEGGRETYSYQWALKG